MIFRCNVHVSVFHRGSGWNTGFWGAYDMLGGRAVEEMYMYSVIQLDFRIWLTVYTEGVRYV